ncbi:hypothetical protein PHAVU_007G216300 [Phaseolus vulgaris]|uniref:DUF761 domain-containing protein n=1 Tax=Phaseolus vulgaris TaxID=3885 RepID=V7BJG1_PHAVU|nr:hypothetical protein PHAVU_007G216300g [Phaseolus vulgaris]ESW17163.1 hypothetical protein PHAVU_007G216300g [Phaseolus vulgaris]
MELNAEKSIIVRNEQNAIIPHEKPNYNTIHSSRKNTRGSKNIFKVALFMMRGRSRKSKMLVDDESKSVWRKIVGSMRPLHLQGDQSPRHHNSASIPQSKTIVTSTPFENDVDHGDDAFDSASEYSPSPSSSRYASAVGLNEMVQEAENEEDGVKGRNTNGDNNDGEGDEMIDAKAEEFIAEFYHQMRLQRFDVVDSHYQEISMRSLGL